MEYQKINTLFMRDEKGIIIPEKFTMPEFDYLKDCKWEATEKIDGTNMRLEIQFSTDDYNPEVLNYTCRICGKTDNAQIPPHLYKKMEDLFGEVNWNEIFPDATPGECVTIYGEGYGAKILNGGNYIRDDVNFILFDVFVTPNWWLRRSSCEMIAELLDVDIVPIIGYMTIPEAIDYVRKGFKSTIAQNPDYDAEGLVLRTPDGICRRDGSRIITKIKTKDFRKYELSKKIIRKL